MIACFDILRCSTVVNQKSLISQNTHTQNLSPSQTTEWISFASFPDLLSTGSCGGGRWEVFSRFLRCDNYSPHGWGGLLWEAGKTDNRFAEKTTRKFFCSVCRCVRVCDTPTSWGWICLLLFLFFFCSFLLPQLRCGWHLVIVSRNHPFGNMSVGGGRCVCVCVFTDRKRFSECEGKQLSPVGHWLQIAH